jgi:DNA-binding NtrC family response regulator
MHFLKIEGFEVYGAENAIKALNFLEMPIDLVLSNPNFGDETGLDLLKAWKQEKPDVPYIVFAAGKSTKAAVEALKAGAYDYIIKPVDLDELVLVIRRALNEN